MYVLAVTGGIGAGKSTACEVFASLGAVVLDLDAMAKGLLEAGSPVIEPLTRAFGPGILRKDGSVEPALLAQAAFASPERARELDAIVHPAVYAACAGALDALALQAQPPRFVVLDIPLLAEAPRFLDLVDAVLAISADEDTRLERLIAGGMDADEVERRMACQAGDAERRAIADYVIENDGRIDQFKAELLRFYEDEVAPRVT